MGKGKKEPVTIESLRERLDLTQRGMAYRLGVSERQYRRWERGEGEIPTRRLAPLARELDITYGELLQIAGEQQAAST